MLTSAETVHAVHAFLAQTEETGRQGKRAPTVVLDPVMVSTSGHSLVDQDATDAIRSTLLGSADWITPNLPEANVLAQTDVEVKSISDMLALARKLSRQCPQSHVLLKGGHLPLSKKDVLAFSKEGTEVVWLDEDEDGACIDVLELYGETAGRPPADQLVVDVLHDAAASPAGGDGPANGSEGGRVTLYVSRMVDTTSTHGTGCTLSSAIACAVAQSPGTFPQHSTELSSRRGSSDALMRRCSALRSMPPGSRVRQVSHRFRVSFRKWERTLASCSLVLPTSPSTVCHPPHPMAMPVCWAYKTDIQTDSIKPTPLHFPPHPLQPAFMEVIRPASVRRAARQRHAAGRVLCALYQAGLPVLAALSVLLCLPSVFSMSMFARLMFRRSCPRFGRVQS